MSISRYIRPVFLVLVVGFVSGGCSGATSSDEEEQQEESVNWAAAETVAVMPWLRTIGIRRKTTSITATKGIQNTIIGHKLMHWI